LLENIVRTPVAEAVISRYAKTPCNFGEGKQEENREIMQRVLPASFKQEPRNGMPIKESETCGSLAIAGPGPAPPLARVRRRSADHAQSGYTQAPWTT
jgi:hypothetical protein